MLTLVRFALGFTLVFTALFLIFLVLIQRGRGGGLAGAFGGMGGQSAFGTKAGDVFTKITVGVAAFWILLCVLSINVLGRQQSLLSGTLGSAAPEAMGPSAGAQPGSPPAAQQPVAPATPPATDAAPPAAATPAAAAPAGSAPTADAPSAPPAAAEPAAAK
jgi:preprotein translocase subunit SecG